MKKKVTKICMISSSGGHLKELNELIEISERYETFQITEKDKFSNIKIGTRQYYVNKIDRDEKNFIFHFFILFLKIFQIFAVEKPKVIVTTGALVAYPACLIGKLMRAKVIFIESYARTETLSLTGKLVYKLSDLFIVQWPDLSKKYTKAKYYGELF